MQSLVRSEGLHTVCQEADCPTIYECWEEREATFLIGGDQCTRRCDFCQIDTGKPEALDRDEPRRVGESVVSMDLNYADNTGWFTTKGDNRVWQLNLTNNTYELAYDDSVVNGTAPLRGVGNITYEVTGPFRTSA